MRVKTIYRLGGRIVAVQTKVGAAAGTFYFTYTDHLGNITALSWTGGTHVSNSTARYDPFGTFTIPPRRAATRPSPATASPADLLPITRPHRV